MAGLPFHLLLAYTGVAIFAASYIFGGTQASYGGDVEKFYEEAGGFYERPEVGRPLESLHSVDALVAEGAAPVLQGERRLLTLLFSDLAGFTAASERLPPEATELEPLFFALYASPQGGQLITTRRTR